MKTTFLILAAVAMLTFNARASLDDANRAFSEERFHDSTAAYQAVIDEKGFSAPVLFDLGNSHYREGNFAQAILAYRRALMLEPGDPDIAANLEAAQKQAGVSATAPAWWERYTGILSASGWAWAASAAWTLLCLNNLAYWFLPKTRSLLTLPGFAMALLLVASVAAILLTSGAVRQNVVMAKNASALISPFPAAQSSFALSAGQTVIAHKTYHDYVLVSDAAGHSGWMAKSQLAAVVAK